MTAPQSPPRLTDADLDAAQALCDAASDGRWTYDDGITDETTSERGKSPCVYVGCDLVAEMHGTDEVGHAAAGVPSLATMDANGRFIAQSRTLVPALLAEVARYRTALRALVDALPKCHPPEGTDRPLGTCDSPAAFTDRCCIDHTHAASRETALHDPLHAAIALLGGAK